MKSVFHRKFKKFVKKIKDKTLLALIKSEVDLLILDNSRGKLLEHPFRKYNVRAVKFLYKSHSYRIAYIVNSQQKEIVFLLIDSRENFYEKLSRIL